MITVTFNLPGDFQAFYAASDWCANRGISMGSMCRGEPIGLMYGDVTIAKWRNLTARERRQCDGKLTGDMRNGPVRIEIREP